MKSFFTLCGRAARLWVRSEADQHAAALAYFTPFALTPLIIVSISIVGMAYGVDRITSMLLSWGNAIDPAVTHLIYNSVQNFDTIQTHYYLPIIGFAFLSVMIIIALNSLSLGLHKLWSVDARGWSNYFGRFFRILFFVVILQLYLVGMILVADAFSFVTYLTNWTIWPFVTFFVSFVSTMLLLALAYGILVQHAPSFIARFVGASMAGLLLLFSRELVALHFATAPVQTLFGAAGLLIVLLVWVYVVACLVLYGAAFAYVYDEARRARRQVGVIRK
jgi:membrane protein